MWSNYGFASFFVRVFVQICFLQFINSRKVLAAGYYWPSLGFDFVAKSFVATIWRYRHFKSVFFICVLLTELCARRHSHWLASLSKCLIMATEWIEATEWIDPATSHAPEPSVAAASNNFWDHFQPHHEVTVREIYREVVTWKPSFFTLGKNKTGEQFAEALHIVLSPIAVNTDRSDISLTLCMILPHLTLSRTKNTDDGSNNKTIKRWLQAWYSCNVSELFCEAKAIQMRMNSRNKQQHSDQDVKRFHVSW